MTTPNKHPRTENRRNFERRYERRFRRIQVRVDADRGEALDELLRDYGLTPQALLNTLLLGWIKTTDDARAALAEQLRDHTPEEVSPRVARALTVLAQQQTDSHEK